MQTSLFYGVYHQNQAANSYVQSCDWSNLIQVPWFILIIIKLGGNHEKHLIWVWVPVKSHLSFIIRLWAFYLLSPTFINKVTIFFTIIALHFSFAKLLTTMLAFTIPLLSLMILACLNHNSGATFFTLVALAFSISTFLFTYLSL